jgi:hypothetical protein
MVGYQSGMFLALCRQKAVECSQRKDAQLQKGVIMSDSKLKLLSFSGKTRILHLSWFAFFLTFVMWFSHAPLLASIREAFELTDH